MENRSEIIIYQTDDGLTKIETRLEDETVWLTQTQKAQLEYDKYKEKNRNQLSKVEEDFIRQIEQTAKQIEKANKENGKL